MIVNHAYRRRHGLRNPVGRTNHATAAISNPPQTIKANAWTAGVGQNSVQINEPMPARVARMIETTVRIASPPAC